MSTTDSHAALINAGFVGRVRVADVAAAGLLDSLYRCEDAGLARFAGSVSVPLPTGGAGRTVAYYYIFG